MAGCSLDFLASIIRCSCSLLFRFITGFCIGKPNFNPKSGIVGFVLIAFVWDCVGLLGSGDFDFDSVPESIEKPLPDFIVSSFFFTTFSTPNSSINCADISCISASENPLDIIRFAFSSNFFISCGVNSFPIILILIFRF